jgi:hypothetical protein
MVLFECLSKILLPRCLFSFLFSISFFHLSRFPNFGRENDPSLANGELVLTGHSYGPVLVSFATQPQQLPKQKDRALYQIVSLSKSDGCLFTWNVEV